MPESRPNRCPCGHDLPLTSCCGLAIEGGVLPATAEALMRSRYTAFVTRNEAYLMHSWHPATRPPSMEFTPRQQWLGLKVVRSEAGSSSDSEGVVEFVARYKTDGKGYRLHEISRFVREAGKWLYVDGLRGPSDSANRE